MTNFDQMTTPEPFATREQLMEDTMQADTAMLLDFLRTRTMQGDIRPITVREALEAIYRQQPDDAVLPREAAHMARVMARVRSMLIAPTQESPG